MIYSIIHNLLISFKPKKYEVINIKSLEENPNTVARNLVEESQRIVLKGGEFQRQELTKFIGHVDRILERVKKGKLKHDEYILYSKLIYMLYFAVNKSEYFKQVPQLHEPYAKSLSDMQIIINNSYILNKNSYILNKNNVKEEKKSTESESERLKKDFEKNLKKIKKENEH